MRKAFALLSVGLVAIAARAQTCPPSKITQRMEKSFERMLARMPRTLGQLNSAIEKYPDSHDAILSVTSIGNEQSVPILLHRYREDYGVAEPTLPPGLIQGFVCTRVHLVDALRTITNTDQGMYYPRWAAWWEANKGQSQHQWMLNGFAAQGLHVAEPTDERFALELIETAGRWNDYRGFNARRLLAAESPQARSQWVELAAESEDRFRRLGAVDVLSQIDRSGHEDLLRRLASDSDLEVRREALTTLNNRLRVSREASARHILLRCPRNEDGIRSASFVGDFVVTASTGGKVRALDPGDLHVQWTRIVAPGLGDRSVVIRDRVILASLDGDLIALGQGGRLLWRKKSDGTKQDRIYRLVRRGEDVLVMRRDLVELLSSSTGELVSSIPHRDTVRDVASDGASTFFVDSDGLHRWGPNSWPTVQLPHASALSASERSVCVFSADAGNKVSCYNPGTGALQWIRKIGDKPTMPGGGAPVQDGPMIIVPTNDSLTALNASDGSVLWSTRGGGERVDRMASTQYGLLIENDDDELELRDPATGEVRRVWKQVGGVYRFSVRRNLAAVVGLNGALWLVDLSDSGSLSPIQQ